MARWQMTIVGLAAGGAIFAAGKWLGTANSDQGAFKIIS